LPSAYPHRSCSKVPLTVQIGVSRDRLSAFTSAVCYGVLQADNSSTADSGSSSYHARSSPPRATQLARFHPSWRPSRDPLTPPIPSFSTEAALSESPRPRQDRACPQRMSGPTQYPATATSHSPNPPWPHPTILHASQRYFHIIIPLEAPRKECIRPPVSLYYCPPDVLTAL
jgi:hypothetical protein